MQKSAVELKAKKQNDMSLKFTETKNSLIITIEGRLDSVNARSIAKKIETRLQGCTKDVIFNVEKLEYMTSAGLQVLLFVSKNRRATGKNTFIHKPQKIVDYVIRISGFYAFLQRIDKIPPVS